MEIEFFIIIIIAISFEIYNVVNVSTVAGKVKTTKPSHGDGVKRREKSRHMCGNILNNYHPVNLPS